MPRFYFQVADGKGYRDWEGTELADLAKAKHMAVHYAADLFREDPLMLLDGEPWSMRVTDHHDRTLFEMTFIARQPLAFPAPRIALTG